MKYYSKSPEELREFLKDKHKVHPFRNRTFLLIFADILLIVVIAVFLDKSGYLTEDKIESSGRYARGGIEFSGSIANFHKDTNDIVFYLKLTNNTFGEIAFPASEGDLYVPEKKGSIELYREESLLRSQEIYLEKKTLQSEKDAYYRFSFAFTDEESKSRKSYRYMMRIPFENGDLTIRFPDQN